MSDGSGSVDRLTSVAMDGELPARESLPVIFDELDYQLACQGSLTSG
ncbi:hypothetical protein [Subtercola sp. YIM 133946]